MPDDAPTPLRPSDLTVVIPAWNAEATIAEAVASVLRSARSADRVGGEPTVIVVDDGSIDDTASVAREAGAQVLVQERLGPAAARNRGLAVVRTPLVGFCDADDRWVDDRVALDLAVFGRDPMVEMSIGRSRFETTDDELLRGHHFDTDQRTVRIPHFGAATLRLSAVERIGPIDESLWNFEDYDWFLRARDLGVRTREHDRVVQVRTVRADSLSRTNPASPHDLMVVLQRSVQRRRAARTSVEARPLNLMWWLPEFPPNLGGIGTFASLVAPALAGRGHSMHLYVGWESDDDDVVPGGVEIIRRPLRKSFERRDAHAIQRERRALLEVKRRVVPDVYHLHPTDPSAVLHLATLSTAPAPTVVTLHNEASQTFVTDNPDSMMGRLLDEAAVITAVSAAAARMATDYDRRLAPKIVTIPNGVEVTADPVEPPHGDRRLLAIGRLMTQKGFDRLLAAMPRVVAACPDVRLDIVGEGAERGRLVAMSGSLGLADVVTFHGRVDRAAVQRCIDAAHVVVAPSRYEGMPLAVLEASMRGRPVVGTDVGGINEVIVDGETGVLVDPATIDRDPAPLADAIIGLLDDADRAVRLGRAGRCRVERRFGVDPCAAAYELVYRSVLMPPVEVAVVIPAWNAARHLGAALESVLAAVRTAAVSCDVLVVDDGSDDDTSAVAAGFAGRGVRAFRQPNLGTGMARNAGLALTNSTFVAHLDADDEWPGDRLRVLLDGFGAGPPTLDAVFGSAVEFADADAPPTASWSPAPQPVRMPTAGLIRRAAHGRIGGFGSSRDNDQISWAAHAIAHGLVYSTVDEVVLHRRIHATNASHRRPFLTDTSRLAVVRDHLRSRRDG
jgi:glycosyltransferase involved in cell wall biosynthesis